MINNTIRYIAVDDNALDLLAVTEYAKQFNFLHCLGNFSNPGDGFTALQDLKPDLVFLDIEMPGMSGMDVLRALKKDAPMAVFITSHPEYALEGFELSALDYILKPLTQERFGQTIVRVQEFHDTRQRAEAYQVHFEQESLSVKEGYNHIRILQNDIVYLEAMQDYTKIVTSAKNYMTLTPLSGFMERLPASRFVRIHRSYAVSLSKVREIRNGEIIGDNFTLPVGKTYRPAVSQLKF
ncbi:DNA-binding response regulator, LytR/AlgR family [Pseudarcicella hirudinis]|uniref:DNA-binding response regulator, LytR/AlgR family n=1 Tax=Pseudarcicella hirudinis TaxID=1079859 RepID=A0A1I5M3J4_9BACT|nr:LytTR family DNA-binding domain-containing protein [Pseudarcicella hirudinis]SFP04075.1 DNA-binding response regulator, LytR/AlgR family [Pseudarcicella hirudinis]